MNRTASRIDVGVVKRTTRMPSFVVLVSTALMSSGMGNPNGTCCSAFVSRAEEGAADGATLGQVGVGEGRGGGVAADVVLPPEQPATTVPASAPAHPSASVRRTGPRLIASSVMRRRRGQ